MTLDGWIVCRLVLCVPGDYVLSAGHTTVVCYLLKIAQLLSTEDSTIPLTDDIICCLLKKAQLHQHDDIICCLLKKAQFYPQMMTQFAFY